MWARRIFRRHLHALTRSMNGESWCSAVGHELSTTWLPPAMSSHQYQPPLGLASHASMAMAVHGECMPCAEALHAPWHRPPHAQPLLNMWRLRNAHHASLAFDCWPTSLPLLRCGQGLLPAPCQPAAYERITQIPYQTQLTAFSSARPHTSHYCQPRLHLAKHTSCVGTRRARCVRVA